MNNDEIKRAQRAVAIRHHNERAEALGVPECETRLRDPLSDAEAFEQARAGAVGWGCGECGLPNYRHRAQVEEPVAQSAKCAVAGCPLPSYIPHAHASWGMTEQTLDSILAQAQAVRDGEKP